MERIPGAELSRHIGTRVRVAGWYHALRTHGKVNFLRLRDASGICQVFLERSETAQLDGILPESVLQVEGVAAEESQAPGGAEIRQPSITAISAVREALPYAVSKPIWLRARSSTNRPWVSACTCMRTI